MFIFINTSNKTTPVKREISAKILPNVISFKGGVYVRHGGTGIGEYFPEKPFAVFDRLKEQPDLDDLTAEVPDLLAASDVITKDLSCAECAEDRGTFKLNLENAVLNIESLLREVRGLIKAAGR